MNTEEVEALLETARAKLKHADKIAADFGAFAVADLCVDLLFARGVVKDLRARLREVEPELHALRKNVEALATEAAMIRYEIDAKRDSVTLSLKHFSEWRSRLERIAEGGDF